jgi:hypothetical protein
MNIALILYMDLRLSSREKVRFNIGGLGSCRSERCTNEYEYTGPPTTGEGTTAKISRRKTIYEIKDLAIKVPILLFSEK